MYLFSPQFYPTLVISLSVIGFPVDFNCHKTSYAKYFISCSVMHIVHTPKLDQIKHWGPVALPGNVTVDKYISMDTPI